MLPDLVRVRKGDVVLPAEGLGTSLGAHGLENSFTHRTVMANDFELDILNKFCDN